MKKLFIGLIALGSISTFAKDISQKATLYVSSTAKENTLFSKEEIQEIEAIRANHLCQRYASSEVESFKTETGSNSQLWTIELDKDKKFLGHYSMGIDYVYFKNNKPVQSKHFQKLVCKD